MSLIGLLTATEKQVHLGRLHRRPIQWHLKNHWRIQEKVIPIPKSLHSYEVVAPGSQRAPRTATAPTQSCPSDAYKCFKRRVGHPFGRVHSKGHLVSPRKQLAYKLFSTKGGLFGLKRVARPLLKQTCPRSYRQHHSGGLYKQERGA